MSGELLRLAFKGWAETKQSLQFSSWELQNISGPSRGRKDIIPKHHWRCDGNRNASVRTVWRLVAPCHQCCLPVLNCSRSRSDQTAFLPHISSGPHFFYFPPWAFHSSGSRSKWMSSTSVAHFSWSLQLLLSQTLLLLRDKCTHGRCSKGNMQIQHIWQAAKEKLHLYLCSLSLFGPATRNSSQNASQRLGLVSEPWFCTPKLLLDSMIGVWSWLIWSLMLGILFKQVPR